MRVSGSFTRAFSGLIRLSVLKREGRDAALAASWDRKRKRQGNVLLDFRGREEMFLL